MKKYTNILLLFCSVHLSFSQAIVVIDAGHGYNQNCSHGDGRTATEINTNYAVAEKLFDALTDSCGYTPFMTRTSNDCASQISLIQRTMMANYWEADLFLSIHCNALNANTTGTETFWCDFAAQPDAEDQAYATLIQNEMADHGSWLNRRVVEDHSYLNFHLSVLRELDMHGSLSEIGFVTSQDSVKLLSDTWREEFKQAYVDAITTFLNIECSESLLDCSNAPTLSCGSWYQGQASTDSSLVTKFGCNNWTETGPERVHRFVVQDTSDVSFVINNYTGDLDAYILSDCHQDSCIGTTYSKGALAKDLPAGEYFLVVDADDGSGSAYELSYFCDTLPELAATEFEFQASVDLLVDTLQVASELFNLGADTTGGFSVKYYFSFDDSIDAADLLIDSFQVSGGLLPVHDLTHDFEFDLTSFGPGSYYLIMHIDALDAVEEQIENNNILAKPFVILGQDITTGISLDNSSEVLLYPNPSKGIFQLITASNFSSFRVFDMHSNLVSSGDLQQTNALDFSHLASGVYQFELKGQQSNSVIKKLIISK